MTSSRRSMRPAESIFSFLLGGVQHDQRGAAGVVEVENIALDLVACGRGKGGEEGSFLRHDVGSAGHAGAGDGTEFEPVIGKGGFAEIAVAAAITGVPPMLSTTHSVSKMVGMISSVATGSAGTGRGCTIMVTGAIACRFTGTGAASRNTTVLPERISAERP